MKFILTKDNIIPIKIYGTIIITYITLNGPTRVSLMDITYIPGYHTNLISLRKAIKKNLHFDTQSIAVINQNQNVIFSLRIIYNQFIAEYNPINNTTFVTQSSYKPRLTNTAPV